MSIEEPDLIHFIVLIMPGLWGLWIYKTFIRTSREPVHWDKDLVLALCFALPGYLLSPHLIMETRFSENLFVRLLITAILSIFLGSMMGGLALIKGIRPTYWFANFLCKRTGRSIETPHGRGIQFVINEMIDPQRPLTNTSQIVTVYNLSNPENKEIGTLVYADEQSNEIVVDMRPKFTHDDIEGNHWETDPWVKSINLDSGMVVEIANVKREFIKQKNELFIKEKQEEYQIPS